MANETLNARTREEVGSAASRRLRRAGELPAALGGGGGEPATLAVATHDFETLHQAGARVVTLTIGGEKVDAFIKDVQWDALGDQMVHVDFDRLVAGQAIEVEVRIEHFGEPEGLAEGGVLMNRLESITVSCQPGVIPDHVEIDVSAMEVGDEIRAGVITLPAGVSLVTDPEEVCVVLAAPELEEEEEEEAEALGEAEGGDEPERIGKKKEGDEEGEG